MGKVCARRIGAPPDKWQPAWPYERYYTRDAAWERHEMLEWLRERAEERAENPTTFCNMKKVVEL